MTINQEITLMFCISALGIGFSKSYTYLYSLLIMLIFLLLSRLKFGSSLNLLKTNKLMMGQFVFVFFQLRDGMNSFFYKFMRMRWTF